MAGVALSDREVTKLVGAFGECEVDLREAYLDSDDADPGAYDALP